MTGTVGPGFTITMNKKTVTDFTDVDVEREWREAELEVLLKAETAGVHADLVALGLVQEQTIDDSPFAPVWAEWEDNLAA